jgi:hypothetical protein
MEQGAYQQEAAAPVAPRLRPLDVGQKLDAAIKLTTRNFGPLAGIILLLVGTVQLLTLVVTLSTLPDDYIVDGSFGGGATPDDADDVSAGFWVGQIIVSLLGFLVYFLAPAACFKAIGSAYMGQKPSASESIKYAFSRFHSILWVSILAGLATIAGFILLIIPGIYVWIIFSLAVPVLMLEGLKGTKALGRSNQLIKDHWWQAFGFLLVAYLLMFVVSFILGGIFGAVMFATVDDESVTAVVLNNVVNLLAQVVTTPFIAAATIVLYFDLRIRKEAFDLQLLAQSIGGQADTSSGTAMPWVAPPGWGQQAGWGQPAQQWGQPQQQWGQQPQQQQQWGQQPPPQPGQAPPQPPGQAPQPPGQGWGQPPPQPPPQQWGQPQQPQPPGQQPGQTQGWGQPPQQPPPQQGGQPTEPQRWEPPAPSQSPPEPPQQWDPPAPPDPPDRSS